MQRTSSTNRSEMGDISTSTVRSKGKPSSDTDPNKACLEWVRVTATFLVYTDNNYIVKTSNHCRFPSTISFLSSMGTQSSGGIAFKILVTSLGVIVLFAKDRTCEPFLSRCKPIATFQLSDWSMRNTYFLPSASRTLARRMCRPLLTCWPVCITGQYECHSPR